MGAWRVVRFTASTLETAGLGTEFDRSIFHQLMVFLDRNGLVLVTSKLVGRRLFRFPLGNIPFYVVWYSRGLAACCSGEDFGKRLLFIVGSWSQFLAVGHAERLRLQGSRRQLLSFLLSEDVLNEHRAAIKAFGEVFYRNFIAIVEFDKFFGLGPYSSDVNFPLVYCHATLLLMIHTESGNSTASSNGLT